MSTTSVIGLQWGDEGKGKVVDLLSESADIVVRYQGGSNAGHTIVIGDEKFILHLIPTGILQKNKKCLIANGVVVDLETLRSEADMLEKKGFPVRGNLFVSNRAHLVMPYHKLIDSLEEKSKGSKKIGTTGRGIGPCYADKIARKGIRVADLFAPSDFKDKLADGVSSFNERLQSLGSSERLSVYDIEEAFRQHAEWLRNFTVDGVSYLNSALAEGKKVLFEGAQGTLLDVDFGTYPYVTSSNSDATGIAAGAGVAPHKLTDIVGVLKAYATRVGGGPFPTELDDETGERLRTKGVEFGATTGRPRRCGWLDTVAASFAAVINGITSIALNKLDVLSGFKRIKVCTAYEVDGRKVTTFPADVASLTKAVPLYEELPGWDTDITGVTAFSDLPENARNYIRFIEERLSTPVSMVSTGPKRSQVIAR